MLQISNWTLLQRNNPAKEYPSDFDVIVLEDSGQQALAALRDHPAVKRVTAQRQVQRTIKYVREVILFFIYFELDFGCNFIPVLT